MPEQCPISGRLVDETMARLTALWVVLLSILYLVTGAWPAIAVILVDFAIRSFVGTKYSPLAVVSRIIVTWVGAGPNMVDAAPKIFAAKIGLGFSLASFILFFVGYLTISKYVIGILSLCAALEAFFRFCLGCRIYSLIKFNQ